MRIGFLLAALTVAGPVFGQDEQSTIGQTVEGSTSATEGLAAWDKIFTVASHPRCTNCHVGDQAQPMWEGLGYKDRALHGMFIQAGESRIGAETIPCRTCHVTSEAANVLSHAAPHIEEAWRLPPIELNWLDKTSIEICTQMRDPETNDGNSVTELAEHVLTSAFVRWGFEPGGGRSAPDGSTEKLAQDILVWGAAGMPCAAD